MPPSSIAIDQGTTTNLATIIISEDGLQKHISRSQLNNSSGTEIGTETDPIRVDPTGDTVQPVSASALPLPTGASTSAKQDTTNSSLASIDGKLPATLGQKTKANSLPVVIASDQDALAVTGTFYQATQPVSGNLGADLRIGGASVTTSNPVPISPPASGALPVSDGGGSLTVDGTVTATLSAETTKVIGTVNIASSQITTLTPQTDALTDTQLRASSVPVNIYPAGASQDDGYNASPITDTTPTVIVPARGAGVVFYMTDITITNMSATVKTTVTITDGNGGTGKYNIGAGTGGGGVSHRFGYPKPFTANTAVYAVCGTTGAEVYVSINGYKV